MMDGGFAARVIEVGLAVSGLLILYFASRAFLSEDAWGEGAEYEMLGEPRPASRKAPAPVAGRLGMEDRVVRIGFAIALTYLALTWFGIGSVAMWAFVLPVAYLTVTGLRGTDPVYRKFGLSSG